MGPAMRPRPKNVSRDAWKNSFGLVTAVKKTNSKLLDTYEGGTNVVRKFFGNDGKRGSEEGCIAQCLHYSHRKRQWDEKRMTLNQ